MKKKCLKKISCVVLAGMITCGITACGSSEPEIVYEQDEEGNYIDDKGNILEVDEDGNPIPFEEPKITFLTTAGSQIVTGFIIKLDESSAVTLQGEWLTELEVGNIAKIFQDNCDYKKGSFAAKEVSHIVNLYDIDNNLICTLYIDKNANVSYNNKYIIENGTMKGIIIDAKNRITDSSIIVMPAPNVNVSTTNKTENPSETEYKPSNESSSELTEEKKEEEPMQIANVDLSMQVIKDSVNIDDNSAKQIAQKTADVGMSTLVMVEVPQANILRVMDEINNSSIISINNGQIEYVYDEINEIYLYAIEGHDTLAKPGILILEEKEIEQSSGNN